MKKKESNFFAIISRMKYIRRWALMRNSRQENLYEHSMDVSIITHALAVIANERYSKNTNISLAVMMAIYHDASEIITGDMPTPIKYQNDNIKKEFKKIEKEASKRILKHLPQDMVSYYEDIFIESNKDIYEWKIVKAADKISALIKCIEEENSGNKEFIKAKEIIEESIYGLMDEMPEVKDFFLEMLPPFGKTLDELVR